MKKFRRIIAMLLAVSFLSMFGCKKEIKFNPVEGAKITSFGMSESQMDLIHCYYFGISEETDGTVYFSAEFRQADTGEKITFDDYKIDKAYMDELRKIADEYNIAEYFKTHKTSKRKNIALDAPLYSCSIKMDDGSTKSLNFFCDGSIELKAFFLRITQKYTVSGITEFTMPQ